MRGIGSQRRWRCVVAIILWASGLLVSLYAQYATKLTPKVLAIVNMPLIELKDADPPLLRVKNERFNAALKEAKARFDPDTGIARNGVSN
jgi:hypothetical protein